MIRLSIVMPTINLKQQIRIQEKQKQFDILRHKEAKPAFKKVFLLTHLNNQIKIDQYVKCVLGT